MPAYDPRRPVTFNDLRDAKGDANIIINILPCQSSTERNRAILNIVNVALLTQVDTDDYLADRD